MKPPLIPPFQKQKWGRWIGIISKEEMEEMGRCGGKNGIGGGKIYNISF
jgi:hypothetical protein